MINENLNAQIEEQIAQNYQDPRFKFYIEQFKRQNTNRVEQPQQDIINIQKIQQIQSKNKKELNKIIQINSESKQIEEIKYGIDGGERQKSENLLVEQIKIKSSEKLEPDQAKQPNMSSQSNRRSLILNQSERFKKMPLSTQQKQNENIEVNYESVDSSNIIKKAKESINKSQNSNIEFLKSTRRIQIGQDKLFNRFKDENSSVSNFESDFEFVNDKFFKNQEYQKRQSNHFKIIDIKKIMSQQSNQNINENDYYELLENQLMLEKQEMQNQINQENEFLKKIQMKPESIMIKGITEKMNNQAMKKRLKSSQKSAFRKNEVIDFNKQRKSVNLINTNSQLILNDKKKSHGALSKKEIEKSLNIKQIQTTKIQELINKNREMKRKKPKTTNQNMNLELNILQSKQQTFSNDDNSNNQEVLNTRFENIEIQSDEIQSSKQQKSIKQLTSKKSSLQMHQKKMKGKSNLQNDIIRKSGDIGEVISKKLTGSFVNQNQLYNNFNGDSRNLIFNETNLDQEIYQRNYKIYSENSQKNNGNQSNEFSSRNFAINKNADPSKSSETEQRNQFSSDNSQNLSIKRRAKSNVNIKLSAEIKKSQQTSETNNLALAIQQRRIEAKTTDIVKEKKKTSQNVDIYIQGIKKDQIDNPQEIMIQNLDIEKYISTDKKRSTSMQELNADISNVQSYNEILQSNKRQQINLSKISPEIELNEVAQQQTIYSGDINYDLKNNYDSQLIINQDENQIDISNNSKQQIQDQYQKFDIFIKQSKSKISNLMSSSKSHSLISNNIKKDSELQIIGKSMSKVEQSSKQQSNYVNLQKKESIFENDTNPEPKLIKVQKFSKSQYNCINEKQKDISIEKMVRHSSQPNNLKYKSIQNAKSSKNQKSSPVKKEISEASTLNRKSALNVQQLNIDLSISDSIKKDSDEQQIELDDFNKSSFDKRRSNLSQNKISLSMAKFDSKYPPSGKESPIAQRYNQQTFFGKKRQKEKFHNNKPLSLDNIDDNNQIEIKNIANMHKSQEIINNNTNAYNNKINTKIRPESQKHINYNQSSFSIILANQKLTEKGISFKSLSDFQQNAILIEQFKILQNLKNIEELGMLLYSDQDPDIQDQNNSSVYKQNQQINLQIKNSSNSILRKDEQTLLKISSNQINYSNNQNSYEDIKNQSELKQSQLKALKKLKNKNVIHTKNISSRNSIKLIQRETERLSQKQQDESNQMEINSRAVGTDDLNEVLNESDQMIINITTAAREKQYNRYQELLANDNNNEDTGSSKMRLQLIDGQSTINDQDQSKLQSDANSKNVEIFINKLSKLTEYEKNVLYQNQLSQAIDYNIQIQKYFQLKDTAKKLVNLKNKTSDIGLQKFGLRNAKNLKTQNENLQQNFGHLLPRVIIKNAIGENKVVFIDPSLGLINSEIRDQQQLNLKIQGDPVEVIKGTGFGAAMGILTMPQQIQLLHQAAFQQAQQLEKKLKTQIQNNKSIFSNSSPQSHHKIQDIVKKYKLLVKTNSNQVEKLKMQHQLLLDTVIKRKNMENMIISPFANQLFEQINKQQIDEENNQLIQQNEPKIRNLQNIAMKSYNYQNEIQSEYRIVTNLNSIEQKETFANQNYFFNYFQNESTRNFDKTKSNNLNQNQVIENTGLSDSKLKEKYKIQKNGTGIQNDTSLTYEKEQKQIQISGISEQKIDLQSSNEQNINSRTSLENSNQNEQKILEIADKYSSQNISVKSNSDMDSHQNDMKNSTQIFVDSNQKKTKKKQNKKKAEFKNYVQNRTSRLRYQNNTGFNTPVNLKDFVNVTNSNSKFIKYNLLGVPFSQKNFRNQNNDYHTQLQQNSRNIGLLQNKQNQNNRYSNSFERQESSSEIHQNLRMLPFYKRAKQNKKPLSNETQKRENLETQNNQTQQSISVKIIQSNKNHQKPEKIQKQEEQFKKEMSQIEKGLLSKISKEFQTAIGKKGTFQDNQIYNKNHSFKNWSREQSNRNQSPLEHITLLGIINHQMARDKSFINIKSKNKIFKLQKDDEVQSDRSQANPFKPNYYQRKKTDDFNVKNNQNIEWRNSNISSMKHKKMDYEGCKSTLKEKQIYESQKLIQQQQNNDINLSSLITTLNKKQSPEKTRVQSNQETKRKKSQTFIIPRIIKEEIVTNEKISENLQSKKSKNSFIIKSNDNYNLKKQSVDFSNNTRIFEQFNKTYQNIMNQNHLKSFIGNQETQKQEKYQKSFIDKQLKLEELKQNLISEENKKTKRNFIAPLPSNLSQKNYLVRNIMDKIDENKMIGKKYDKQTQQISMLSGKNIDVKSQSLFKSTDPTELNQQLKSLKEVMSGHSNYPKTPLSSHPMYNNNEIAGTAHQSNLGANSRPMTKQITGARRKRFFNLIANWDQNNQQLNPFRNSQSQVHNYFNI